MKSLNYKIWRFEVVFGLLVKCKCCWYWRKGIENFDWLANIISYSDRKQSVPFQVESRYYGDGEDAYAMKRDLTTFLKSCEQQEKELEQKFAQLTLGKDDAAIVEKNGSKSWRFAQSSFTSYPNCFRKINFTNFNISQNEQRSALSMQCQN